MLPDTIDFLVGHSRGLNHVYVDATLALGLHDAVAKVPPMDRGNVLELNSRAQL